VCFVLDHYNQSQEYEPIICCQASNLTLLYIYDNEDVNENMIPLRFYRAIYHWHTTTTTNNNNTIIIIVHRESSVFLIEHYISGGKGWYHINRLRC
jgi:hypothetical protein